jgi:transposase
MRAEILSGPERRRRWSADQKLQIVREASAPGTSVADVARRYDISRQQLYQWRAALRAEGLKRLETGVAGFLQVEVSMPTEGAEAPLSAGAESGCRFEIILPGGRTIRVPCSLSTGELRRLIRAVEGA